jgi:hypothetical protein
MPKLLTSPVFIFPPVTSYLPIPDYDNYSEAFSITPGSWSSGRNTAGSYRFLSDSYFFGSEASGQRYYFTNENGAHAGFINGDNDVIGTSGNDIFYLSNGKNLVHAGNGDDLIVGGDGAERLFGGQDNDTLYGNGGNDYLNGGSGNDDLMGGLGKNTLAGGTGNDAASYIDLYAAISASLYTGKGGTIADASVRDTYNGIENLYGSHMGDNLVGNDSDNVINGGDGFDYINGMGGDDFLSADQGGGRIDAGDGNDYLTTTDGMLLAYGAGGDDTINVNGASFFIAHGDDGFDTLMLQGNALDWSIEDEGILLNVDTGVYEHSFNVNWAVSGTLFGEAIGIEQIKFEDGTTILV